MAMRMAAAVALVAVMGVLLPRAAAQTPNTPDCAAKLVPCAPYMNGTTPPPETCCDPLKDAVKNDLKCLCDLYAAPDIFKAFNISLNEALGLSKRCGLSDTTAACKGLSPSQSPPAHNICQLQLDLKQEDPLFKPLFPNSAETVHCRPHKLPVLSGSPSSGNSNAVLRALSFGFPGLMSLFLALWSV